MKIVFGGGKFIVISTPLPTSAQSVAIHGIISNFLVFDSWVWISKFSVFASICIWLFFFLRFFLYFRFSLWFFSIIGWLILVSIWIFIICFCLIIRFVFIFCFCLITGVGFGVGLIVVCFDILSD